MMRSRLGGRDDGLILRHPDGSQDLFNEPSACDLFWRVGSMTRSRLGGRDDGLILRHPDGSQDLL